MRTMSMFSLCCSLSLAPAIGCDPEGVDEAAVTERGAARPGLVDELAADVDDEPTMMSKAACMDGCCDVVGNPKVDFPGCSALDQGSGSELDHCQETCLAMPANLPENAACMYGCCYNYLTGEDGCVEIQENATKCIYLCAHRAGIDVAFVEE
ncbi:hypothetical protein [Nannocystis punicea]|uniref:Secreted protein n=1 Tax=Nannocystis punicea TaxID=2995304 RepID=A0ABY7GW74_9BACT|nr:hypothetical protein [Nannocystis poenicansa]WAS91212.1 hypothetical protein O0S08_33915 [Nannocystis poenicansa]